MERRAAESDRRSTGATKPRGQPTPHELQAFIRLAETLHFGRTARRLGLAQSSLSEAIRRLESKLDVVLFERTSRRVELTSAGTELLPVAHKALEGLAAARTAAAAPARGTEFRVGIEGQGFAELNHPILSEFIARHPDTRLVVEECPGIPQAFLDARFDVALLRTPLYDERTEVHDVATEPRGLVVPAGHPAAGAEGVTVAEFFDAPFVALSPDLPSTRDYWLARDLRGGEAPHVGGEANNTWEAVCAVAHHGLVTVGCRSFVRSFPMAGLGFAGADDLSPNTLSVVTRSGDTRPIVDEFVEMARRVASDFAEDAAEISPLAPA